MSLVLSTEQENDLIERNMKKICRAVDNFVARCPYPVVRVSYDDFVAADGSMVTIKEEGKLRQEGRDYVMQDGDIVEFKFNVSK